MKKTFTINISGTIFHIEEDAYEVLQKYLYNLKIHFGDEEEGREILNDIEARIAEIFIDRASGEKQVVTLVWVQEVIEIMGTPEDFVKEEAEEDDPYVNEVKRRRRLYRDPEHRVIGGVSSGLAAYFNMDPVIIRIIFVLLTIGTSGVGLLAYIVLWIAVPKAVTTAQRLEMRGQEATVKNIEKSIREEVKEVQESYKKFRQSDTYAKGRAKIDGAGDIIYHVFRLLLKVVVIIMGSFLIIVGILGLLGLISTITIGHTFIDGLPFVWGPDIHLPDILYYLVEPGIVQWGMIAIGFIAGIPMLAMLFIGSKLVFRYKSNNTAVGLGLAGVWLIALISLFVLSTSQLRNFRNESTVAESEKIQCDTCQILYLKLGEDIYKGYAAHSWDMNHLRIMQAGGEKIMLGTPQLDIEKSVNNEFSLTIKKTSRGRTREHAREFAEDMKYTYELKDSLLIFDPYFLLDKEDKWRDQRMQITLRVPEGREVYLDKEMVHIIYDIQNVTNTWDRDMVGKYWEMRTDGLALKETLGEENDE